MFDNYGLWEQHDAEQEAELYKLPKCSCCGGRWKNGSESMKKLFSVFTDDLDHCIFTGCSPVERHHIFGGANRQKCEEYGFIAPLRPDLHPNGVFAGREAKRVDIRLKTMAQEYYEIHIGTREQFRQEFGKSYL